jgi:hypothetical protein
MWLEKRLGGISGLEIFKMSVALNVSLRMKAKNGR